MASRHGDRWQADLARRWADRLNSTAFIPMSRPQLEERLAELVGQIARALGGDADIVDIGRSVGNTLVDIHATAEDSLIRSLELLREGVVREDADESVRHVMLLLSAIAAGYASADRESTLQQQETLKQALLRSKLQADRELAVSEARFREVFTSTPIGVAICDLAGKFVEVNPALAVTLGYSEQDLAAKTIHDLFHPEDAHYLTAAYSELVDSGGSLRLRERKRLLRADGRQAWVYLAVSVLKGSDGTPAHFVTMVEDVSELHLLQERFQHQALHDVMTGLPNRQFFRTRLESALGKLPKDAVITLYHLGLDGFELINDGLGHEIGDGVIKVVARRLEQLIADEEALLARFGGTEFGILIWEGPRTPPVHEFTATINEVLAEPIYFGQYGIATSASIGAVRTRVADGDPTAMLWEVDVALRRAESVGTRQWALFDPDRAPSERTEAKLAAVLPGGLELGELDVLYQPVVDMRDGRVIALEAQLCWDSEEFGRLEHDTCLRHAERSGVTLSLRDWMLRIAWQQLEEWHHAGHGVPLMVSLSPNQARDPDLVATVRRALDQNAMSPEWLYLGMPMSAILGGNEETRENVQNLQRLGVRPALHTFRGSAEELHYLRQLPVDTVRLDNDLVDLVHHASCDNEPEVRSVLSLADLVHACEARLFAGKISTSEQERWWREMGCEIGSGPLYGEPLPSFDVPTGLLRPL